MSDFSGLEAADWGTRARSIGIAILLTIAGFAGAYAAVIVGANVLAVFGINLQNRPALLYPVGTVLQGLGFGIAVLAYVAYRQQWGLVKLRIPTRVDLLWTLLGLVALLAALAVIQWVFTQLGVQVATNQVEKIGMQHPEMMLYMIPLAFLVIGPGEELLFRAGVQGILRKAYAPAPAIVIASGLFGVAHTMALTGQGKLAYIGAVTVLGCILGAIYERTDNLVVPSLVHGAYNAIIFIGIYAKATGMAG